jgi:hypothetical protein
MLLEKNEKKRGIRKEKVMIKETKKKCRNKKTSEINRRVFLF